MDRELLIEIGTEEIPASWLPALEGQVSARLEARLHELRLPPAAAVEGYSTPRRLTLRVGKIAERQTDTEEVVTGPALSAAFADGQPTPAAHGFARKLGVSVDALERLETPKGVYLAFKRQLRGKAAVDVLPDVLSGVLREISFPRMMRWDAMLDDGRGELPFGRPIRWLLFLYGGRVVPFTIFRTPLAQGPLVQEVRSAAVTFGHRFLTTSGRAGRAIKVKGFEDYRKRLAENFVVLERSERRDRIARELDVEARRRGGRIATALVGQTLLEEVPDLVEYPSVVCGAFAEEFLSLPPEVLTTTMIHHQHFFPVVSDQHKLMPLFLAVLNLQPERPEVIARNLERVLTARLRDARFFWESDRTRALADNVGRLASVLFHKKLGSYREKAERIARLARWIAEEVFGRTDQAPHAETAGRLAKADLATDMVRELTELQGTMGGIYAREDGQPEEVWRAVTHHYLPTAVEADAPPSREQLGNAAVPWAAVSLADKLDTVVGLFAAGERPTGSRDPYGLRRAAQGIVRLLMFLPELTGIDRAPTLRTLVSAAAKEQPPDVSAGDESLPFLFERLLHALAANGTRAEVVRAYAEARLPLDSNDAAPLEARRIAAALSEMRSEPRFVALATVFKRVKNIAKDVAGGTSGSRAALREPAEVALAAALDDLTPRVKDAVASGRYKDALAAIASVRDEVDRFFVDVLVMAEDPALRAARLGLMAELRDLVVRLADVSAIVIDEQQPVAAGS
jgi:glycyl-tRNA synthetase beta chain